MIFDNRTIQIKRATRNAHNLSSFSVIGTVKGYLKALSEADSSINGLQYGQGFVLVVNSKAGIKVGDKLEIEGKEYNVQALSNKNQNIGSIRSKRIILSLNV